MELPSKPLSIPGLESGWFILMDLIHGDSYWFILINVDSCRFMLVHIGSFVFDWLMLVHFKWCWWTLINVASFCFIFIHVDSCWFMLIHSDSVWRFVLHFDSCSTFVTYVTKQLKAYVLLVCFVFVVTDTVNKAIVLFHSLHLFLEIIRKQSDLWFL